MDKNADSNRRKRLVMVGTIVLWVFGTLAYAYTYVASRVTQSADASGENESGQARPGRFS